MKYLLTTTEVYRVDSEEEVDALIDETKQDPMWQLQKYDCKYKEVKAKGEVIDDFYQVSLVKYFTNMKEPERKVIVSYQGG